MLISSYIYIPVGDLEKAAGWYEKMLDFNVIYRDSLYFDMRTDNGVKIMLIPSEKNISSIESSPSIRICILPSR